MPQAISLIVIFFCKSNEALQWDDEGQIDCLVYLNGRTYIRHFLTWDVGEGYTLRIGEENGLQSFVKWEIDSISENESQLTITVHPYLLAGYPKVVSFLPYQLWIKPRMLECPTCKQMVAQHELVMHFIVDHDMEEFDAGELAGKVMRRTWSEEE